VLHTYHSGPADSLPSAEIVGAVSINEGAERLASIVDRNDSA
jgi:hypothetical protein